MSGATMKRIGPETSLLLAILDYAYLRGWLVMHQRPGRLKGGTWRTAIQGDPGFPDLVLCRGTRLVVAELKSSKGTTSEPQRLWLNALQNTGAEVFLWRPEDWTQILGTLHSHSLLHPLHQRVYSQARDLPPATTTSHPSTSHSVSGPGRHLPPRRPCPPSCLAPSPALRPGPLSSLPRLAADPAPRLPALLPHRRHRRPPYPWTRQPP